MEGSEIPRKQRIVARGNIYDEYDRPDRQFLGKFSGRRTIGDRIHILGEDFRMSSAATPLFSKATPRRHRVAQLFDLWQSYDHLRVSGEG
jgi:hypothetical protein